MFDLAKHTMAGLLTGLFCVGLGVVLHACTAETAVAQNALNPECAAQMC